MTSIPDVPEAVQIHISRNDYLVKKAIDQVPDDVIQHTLDMPAEPISEHPIFGLIASSKLEKQVIDSQISPRNPDSPRRSLGKAESTKQADVQVQLGDDGKGEAIKPSDVQEQHASI